MTVQLNTHTVTTTFNSPPYVSQSGGTFRMEVPQSSVMLAKPVSYEFRVAEYVDKTGNIIKVGLQYRMWEHDNYGVGIVVIPWTDVERVKVPSV